MWITAKSVKFYSYYYDINVKHNQTTKVTIFIFTSFYDHGQNIWTALLRGVANLYFIWIVNFYLLWDWFVWSKILFFFLISCGGFWCDIPFGLVMSVLCKFMMISRCMMLSTLKVMAMSSRSVYMTINSLWAFQCVCVHQALYTKMYRCYKIRSCSHDTSSWRAPGAGAHT